MQRLVDKGNSIVVIEHNLDGLIRCADWVIGPRPEGASKGRIVAGHRHARAGGRAPSSHTGRYLKTVLPNTRRLLGRRSEPRRPAAALNVRGDSESKALGSAAGAHLEIHLAGLLAYRQPQTGRTCGLVPIRVDSLLIDHWRLWSHRLKLHEPSTGYVALRSEEFGGEEELETRY